VWLCAASAAVAAANAAQAPAAANAQHPRVQHSLAMSAPAQPQGSGALASPQALLTDTDYENMTIQWNDCEDYEIIRKVRVCIALAWFQLLFCVC